MQIIEFIKNIEGTSLIIGANGVGKSTLFQTIFQEITDVHYHKQSSYFLGELKLMENISFFEELFHKKLTAEVKEYLDKIQSKIEARKLSGGEKQILSLALTTLTDKKLVLLDEADSDLDISTKNEYFFDRIILSGLKGKKIIAISHDLDLARNYFDKVYLMTTKRELKKVDKHLLDKMLEQYKNTNYFYKELEFRLEEVDNND
ncbi:MAG: ABC transporter ATP-binding protein [Fusobacteriaceae bacterium]